MSGSTSGKGLAKGGRRLIRLVNSRPTQSNTIPCTSVNPNLTPSTTLIPNRTSSLSNSHASPFSSPRNQTPAFNFEESPQPEVDAYHSISSSIQLESPSNLDSSTEVNITRRGKTQIWPDGKGYDFYILEFYLYKFRCHNLLFYDKCPFFVDCFVQSIMEKLFKNY